MSDNLISIIKDRSCDIPEVLAERYLIKKYNFAIGNLAIIDVKGFLDFIKKEYKTKDAVVFDFGSKRNSQYIEALDDSFLIFISQYSDTGSVEIYGKDMQITANVHNNLKDFLNSEDDIQVHMHNYTLEGKLSYKEIILEKDKLGKFSKKYYPDFIDLDLFFEQYTKTDENILILSGETGTGKTKLMNIYMQYLLENFSLVNDDPYDDLLVAYVKNEEILASDMFWSNLRDFDYNLVILDDLDMFLSPRGENMVTEKQILKDKFLSNLLSFTDGIVPSKTKFIITTNKGVESIDTAIQRDGRLFGIFAFSKLDPETAKEIWIDEGLDLKDFDIEFKDMKEILQAKLGKTIKQYKINNNKKLSPYLKNKNADISKKDLKKKIGI